MKRFDLTLAFACIFAFSFEVEAKVSDADQIILDVETTNKAIKSTDEIIKLYSEVLDRVVPWQAFNESLADLDKYKKDYSKVSAELIVEIKALMKDGIDAYYRASNYVIKWCNQAIPLLTIYVELFNDHTVQKAYTQKNLLLELFAKGAVEMKQAQQAIGDSATSFNQVTGKLTTLISRLKVDFDEKSAFVKTSIAKVRRDLSRSKNLFTFIASRISDAVLKAKLAPIIQKEIQRIQAFYIELQLKVEKAFHDVETTKKLLHKEIVEIGELKVKIKETKTFIDLDDIPELRDTLKQSAQNLIDDCSEYRRKHENLKLLN